MALAGHFNLRLYCVSVSNRDEKDSDILELFRNVPERSVILLEDIDAVDRQLSRDDRTTKDEEDKKGGITLSGLLNAIDGATSSDGTILIVTSNYPDRLDKALKRPGRIDYQFEFPLSSRHQIEHRDRTSALRPPTHDNWNIKASASVCWISDCLVIYRTRHTTTAIRSHAKYHSCSPRSQTREIAKVGLCYFNMRV
ncbi:hypothetical protein M011DRAFT_469770 [Sporormia fimetaria CBS 119925]|uniref:ATPase AAA-type core domain-containing protein n=1 Tax=Sporormia fimetaria CBS 119925 TaxID=1340428 RepID=A0A6A6V6B3_9PLEO|nr:hypothetical protein M011DRAFT_469770 [Sporormia fimetaria CBS 119925]